MSDYEGEWQLTGMGVSGWAVDKDSPEPIWLELLVDDVVMGIARADLREPENCGFWMPVPSQALESGRRLEVRVANVGVRVGQPLCLGMKDKGGALPGLQGEMSVDRGLTIAGWAVDTLKPEQSIRVSAVVDDRVVAETLACGSRFRPEQGDGHGFVLHLPVSLADGDEHRVTVQDAAKRALPGSPVSIRVWPENLADWIERTPKPDGKHLALLATLMRRLEVRVPGACGDYSAWKATFPIPKPQGGLRCTVDGLDNQLRGQKCVEARPGQGRGDYVFVLREGEALQPFALAHMARVQRQTGAGLVFADSERDGKAVFRPCFDADMFWGRDYLGPFLVTREVATAAGARGDLDEWAWRVRLVRAALEHGGIRHLPQVLSRDLPVPEETGRAEAVREWVSSLQADAQFAEEGGLGRVRWSRACLPAVTVIIPTRDHAPLLRTCLKSLYRTDYPGLDILIVDNGSTDRNALRLLRAAERQPGTRVMKYPGPFNYAAINNAAVREATGDYVCFLNNDTEVINADWLTEMASLLVAQGDRAGCVGAKLLWPNGLVQHGGVVVGTHELAAHIGNGWMADEPGYGQRNRLVCQYSAVTAACLLTPKRLFADLGGFDARRFPVAFNDVDYCLRVRRSGKKILWTPFATLWHRESASRGQDVSPMDKARLQREMGCFRKEWGTYQDPFYNPNLPLSTVTDPFEGLAVPPRARNAR